MSEGREEKGFCVQETVMEEIMRKSEKSQSRVAYSSRKTYLMTITHSNHHPTYFPLHT